MSVIEKHLQGSSLIDEMAIDKWNTRNQRGYESAIMGPSEPQQRFLRWYPWALQQLQPLSAFEENWDGYNGASPVKVAVELAADVLASLKAAFEALPEPSVNPIHDGGVCLDWTHNFRTLEIEIGMTSSIEFLFRDKTLDRTVAGRFDLRNENDAARHDLTSACQTMF